MSLIFFLIYHLKKILQFQVSSKSLILFNSLSLSDSSWVIGRMKVLFTWFYNFRLCQIYWLVLVCFSCGVFWVWHIQDHVLCCQAAFYTSVSGPILVPLSTLVGKACLCSGQQSVQKPRPGQRAEKWALSATFISTPSGGVEPRVERLSEDGGGVCVCVCVVKCCMLDITWALHSQTHSSYGYLHETCIKSSQSTLQRGWGRLS